MNVGGGCERGVGRKEGVFGERENRRWGRQLEGC